MRFLKKAELCFYRLVKAKAKGHKRGSGFMVDYFPITAHIIS